MADLRGAEALLDEPKRGNSFLELIYSLPREHEMVCAQCSAGQIGRRFDGSSGWTKAFPPKQKGGPWECSVLAKPAAMPSQNFLPSIFVLGY